VECECVCGAQMALVRFSFTHAQFKKKQRKNTKVEQKFQILLLPADFISILLRIMSLEVSCNPIDLISWFRCLIRVGAKLRIRIFNHPSNTKVSWIH